jgi:hypothetical protein
MARSTICDLLLLCVCVAAVGCGGAEDSIDAADSNLEAAGATPARSGSNLADGEYTLENDGEREGTLTIRATPAFEIENDRSEFHAKPDGEFITDMRGGIELLGTGKTEGGWTEIDLEGMFPPHETAWTMTANLRPTGSARKVTITVTHLAGAMNEGAVDLTIASDAKPGAGGAFKVTRSTSCTLTLKPEGTKVVVDQEGECIDEGMGHNVRATGTYARH